MLMNKKTLAIAAGAALFIVAMAGVTAAQQSNFDNVQIRTSHVQGNVYMLTGAGGNTTVQVGKDGVLLVDTQFAPMAPKIMAEIRKLTKGPVLFIVNTHAHPDHVGGNGALAGLIGVGEMGPLGRLDGGQPLKIIAHGNVLNRLTERVPNQPRLVPDEGLPEDQYFTPFKDLNINGEAVIIYHEPNAHTDGDSVVLFRGSDVVVTGDIFTPGGYPAIDVDRGGSVQGEIAALNHILDLTVPGHTQEGGTYVIPGHGRICDEADVVEFRDMVVIIRDRVQDGIKKGLSLEQIKASRPTRDYDTEYVTPNSFVKSDQLVEMVYKSLTKK
jgi:cyclase